MKELAKNVLKEQPENIYVFAAEYFENLIRERDGSLDKGYETFRQYEEDLKRRKNEYSPNPNVSAGPSASDATDMEVQGVAIKAKPRESKLAKLPMNRRKRLDAVKSESQDSVVDDEGKPSSPPVTQEIDTVAEQRQQHQTTAMDIGSVVEHMPRVLSSKMSAHNLNAIEEETNADVCETQAVAASAVQTAVGAQKMTSDDLEQSETPTFDTSLSDALTVIELGPVEEVNDTSVDGMKNEIVETHVVAASDDDDVARKTAVNEETLEAKDVAKLHAIPNIDRLQTPESDSGLSEKSFNLKVQENEEIAVDEDNTIGDAESLIFSADIDMSKESADRIETLSIKGDESESIDVAIETASDANVAVGGDLSSIKTTNAGDESVSNEIEENAKISESGKDDESIATDHMVDVVEKAQHHQVEKPDEKNENNPEIKVKTELTSDSVAQDIEPQDIIESQENIESHENADVNLKNRENADGADAGDHVDGQIDIPTEIAYVLPANSVDNVADSSTPVLTMPEEKIGESEKASFEPWQSAMDDLAEKVNEIDANQKRIVREIRHEAEKETETALHPDKLESHHSTETHGENVSKVDSENDSAELKSESVAAKSRDAADEKVDSKTFEQDVVNDIGEGESVQEVSIANDANAEVETMIGDDIIHQVTAESTVDSLALKLDEKVSEGTKEEPEVNNEKSEQRENETANVVVKGDKKKEEEPAAGNISINITADHGNADKGNADQGNVEKPTENEEQALPPPNESQESADALNQTDEIADERKPEALVKLEPEADADTKDEIKTEIGRNSEDLAMRNKPVTDTDESQSLNTQEDPSNVRSVLEEEPEITADMKNEDETNEISPTVELESEESNRTTDNNEPVMPLDANQLPLVKENQISEEKINKDIPETETNEEMIESEFAPIENKENNQAAQDSAHSTHIEGNNETSEPNTESKDLIESSDGVGDRDGIDKFETSLPVGSVDNNNADSNEPASVIVIDTEADGKIENSLENVESADNNLEALNEPDVEDQIIVDSIIADKISEEANVGVKTDTETVDSNDEKSMNPMIAAVQRNEQLLNEMHSSRPNIPVEEIVPNELKPEKTKDEIEENDSNVKCESPVGTGLNTEVDLTSNDVKETDVSGQATTNSGNEILAVAIGEIDVAKNSDVADPNSAAYCGEAPVFSEDATDALSVTAAEQSGKFVSPIFAAMRNNEQFLNEMHSPRTGIDETAAAEELGNDQRTENSSTPAGGAKQQSDIDGDGISELSASNLDESFEHAETVIMGDESVKDMDLSAHDDLENVIADLPNVEENATKELRNEQIEPDSLDMLADSLDASLEPSMEPDSLLDSRSIDSLEAKAITTIVVVGDTTIDDTMPSLNLSSIEDETHPAGNAVEVPLPSPNPSDVTIQQPLGDVVNDKNNYRNFNERMKNQLAALDNVGQQPSIPIQIFNIQEVDSPLTPNPLEMTFDLPPATNKTILFEEDDKTIEQMVKEAAAELTPLKSAECVGVAIDADTGPSKPQFSISQDVASSDLSDTDTDKEKVEKIFSESGVDESSRDERDEVSEVENFDLSSCGEDSLEAMYYQIRKSEIMVDKGKQKTSDANIADDKIAFPGKATENLEQAFREVSGKRSLRSMESSMDEVIVCQLSADTDGMHLISGGENESETDTSASKHRPAVAAAETTDEEFTNPIAAAMQRNQQLLHKMHSVTSHQDEELEQENDHFPSGYSMDVDDMNVGNIRRKIMASSMSEADSDYFEHQPSAAQTHRLTKDDFNVSTAFEHMLRTDSTTDSESTIESAATKIQAGARGFLTRRRLRRSSAGTSASVDKHSSIGNAAIDKSLDDHVENNAYKLLEHLESDETIDGDESAEDKMNGIIDVKMVQKKPFNDEDAAITRIITSESHPGEDEGNENETDENDGQTVTAQRRLMLQRGDAMQRYSTPDESSVAISHQSTASKLEPSSQISGEKFSKLTQLQQSNGMNISTLVALEEISQSIRILAQKLN